MSGSGAKRRKGLFRCLQEDAAVRELLVQPTISAVAKAVGVGDSTLRRWMAQPAFRKKVTAAQRAALTATVRVLVGHSAGALGVINALLASKNEAIKLRAADLWLTHTRAFLVVCDQQQQIDELQGQVNAMLAAQEAGK